MASERTRDRFRFSTAQVPAPERLRSWNGEFGRPLSRRVLVPAPGTERDFHIEMTAHRLECDDAHRDAGSVVSMSATGGGTARRTPELLRDGNDDFVLHIQRAGTRTVFQRGREVTVEAGGAVFTSNGDTSRISLAGSSRFACIAIPRRIALALAPAAEDAVMRCVPPGAGVLRLLETYLGVLDGDEALRTPELRRTVTTHIYDLCALAIGAAREATEVAVRRGLRAARLRALKADVERNLVHGDVSPAALARRQGITARYVHKLFELDGTTLSRFKLRLRLSEVHRRLVGNGPGGVTISEIAFSAGFNDLSTFNREFRRCYGVTPTELRAWARP